MRRLVKLLNVHVPQSRWCATRKHASALASRTRYTSAQASVLRSIACDQVHPGYTISQWQLHISLPRRFSFSAEPQSGPYVLQESPPRALHSPQLGPRMRRKARHPLHHRPGALSQSPMTPVPSAGATSRPERRPPAPSNNP